MSRCKELIKMIEEVELEGESKIEFTEAKDHNHVWEVNAEGDGISKDGDHIHEVIAFLALPGTEDGHVHRLDLPAVTEAEEWLLA